MSSPAHLHTCSHELSEKLARTVTQLAKQGYDRCRQALSPDQRRLTSGQSSAAQRRSRIHVAGLRRQRRRVHRATKCSRVLEGAIHRSGWVPGWCVAVRVPIYASQDLELQGIPFQNPSAPVSNSMPGKLLTRGLSGHWAVGTRALMSWRRDPGAWEAPEERSTAYLERTHGPFYDSIASPCHFVQHILPWPSSRLAVSPSRTHWSPETIRPFHPPPPPSKPAFPTPASRQTVKLSWRPHRGLRGATPDSDLTSIRENQPHIAYPNDTRL